MTAGKTGSQPQRCREDLEALGEDCLAKAAQLKKYLSVHGHDQPTFDQDGPAGYPSLPPDMEEVRLQLRESAKALYELASQPEDVLNQDLYEKIHDITAFGYVSRYNIAENVPLGGTISYCSLAEKTGTSPTYLKKCLRQLMTLRVFREAPAGHVMHTASSKRLLERGIRLFNDFICIDTFKLAPFQLDAIDKWGHDSQEPNQTANNIVSGTDKALFDAYAEIPGKMGRFSELMEFVSKASGNQNSDHLLGGFDWASLGAAVLVDVGGSVGHCAAAIAAVSPEIAVVVQDLPDVIERALAVRSTVIPASVSERISFMTHDFMKPQPVAADIYFLRMILHDWSDKFCVSILRNTVAAMRPGSRILIMDAVLPPAGDWPTILERGARAADLQMGLLFNAKERDIEQWKELFSAADPRLEIRSVTSPPRSLMSIIEVGFAEGKNGLS